MLPLEGFTRVEYVEVRDEDADPSTLLTRGRADITMDSATALVAALDHQDPITVLAGVHGGCYELFGSKQVRAIRDLKGRRIAISATGSADHIYISSMLAYVGVNPTRDVQWVGTGNFEGPKDLFIQGKVDAFLGFPPQPQEMRAKKIGHVIVNTSQDRPWSQHFCCMIAGNRDFVRRHPIATKRVMRAILKAADLCVANPAQAARFIVDKGYEANYDIALEVVTDVSYKSWRTFDPEDTLRFHALRLHEVKMSKTDPNKLIAQGTDWHYLAELKRELKV